MEHNEPDTNIPHADTNLLACGCYAAAVVIFLLLIFGIKFVPGSQGFVEAIGGALALLAIIAFCGRPGSRVKFHALQADLLLCVTIIIIQVTVCAILTQPVPHDPENLGAFIIGLEAFLVYGFWVLAGIVLLFWLGCKAGDGNDPRLAIIGDLAAKIAKYRPDRQ